MVINLNLAARREELEKSKMQLVSQLGAVYGQLTLLTELEAEAAAPPAPPTPPTPPDDPPAQ